MLLSVMALAMAAAGQGPRKSQLEEPSPPPMKCETGPVERTFGGTEWIVYSCNAAATSSEVKAMAMSRRVPPPATPLRE
jgi:hypothetical protein